MQRRACEGGRVRHEIELQDAVRDAALVEDERSILLALEEVDDAVAACTQEPLRCASPEAAGASAEPAAELAAVRDAEGGTSRLEVLDAQRTHLRAAHDLAASAGLDVADLVRLDGAHCGGWGRCGGGGATAAPARHVTVPAGGRPARRRRSSDGFAHRADDPACAQPGGRGTRRRGGFRVDGGGGIHTWYTPVRQPEATAGDTR